MRLAILLNGHFRLYNHLFGNFNDHLLTPFKNMGFKIDIFFSCWNELTNKNSFSVKHRADGLKSQEIYGEFNLQDILDKYNPKKYFVGEYEKYKHLFNIHKYLPDLDLDILHKDIHEGETLFCLNQYFHRAQVNRLKREYEKENNFKYDLVISCRPDLLYLIPFPIDRIDINKLNLRTKYTDSFLLSNSEMDDKISSLFYNIQSIVDKHKGQKVEWFENYCPEFWLEHWYNDIGLTMEQRVELGEDIYWLFPRTFWLETCYEIYKKTNQLEKFEYIVKYFNLR